MQPGIYTAKEILKEARKRKSVETFLEQGKTVNIGGLNVTSSEEIINVPAAAEELEILIPEEEPLTLPVEGDLREDGPATQVVDNRLTLAT